MFLTKHMKKLISANKWLYILIIICTIINNLTRFIIPKITGYTIDTLISGLPSDLPDFVNDAIDSIGGPDYLLDNLWILGASIMVVAVCQMILGFGRVFTIGVTSENISKTMKDNLYYHLQHLPFKSYSGLKSGDIIQRCTNDVEIVRRFLANQMMDVFRILILIIIALFFMLQINVVLTFFSLIILPFVFLFSFTYSNGLLKKFLVVEETEGKLSSTIQENVKGMRVIKAFGREKFELEKFDKLNNEMRSNSISFMDSMANFWATSDAMCFLQYTLVIFVGGYLGYLGKISTGNFIIFLSYASMVIWPVRQLGRIFSEFSKAKVSVTRISEILDMELEQDDPNSVTPDIKGNIKVENLSFIYHDGTVPVLKNLNFEAKQGETIGILGKTGSGKSSLMHILLRLYDYDEGSITIDGVELNTIQKLHLRKNVGIVLQDNFLYAKTIFENLRMANEDSSDNQIYNSTKVASIHNTIKGFDKGYDTLVGEEGVTLSGGQKQRTTIARTLTKDSPILIFDDSLSAVDTETDLKIRQSLKENNANATTFIISQRLTTLMDCDKIIVMEDGEIENIGTHDELLNVEGLYKEIWDMQNLDPDNLLI